MYGCENWTVKKAQCRRIDAFDVGGDSLESIGLPGDQTSQSRGNQSWIFMGGTDAEAEASIIWLPDAKT